MTVANLFNRFFAPSVAGRPARRQHRRKESTLALQQLESRYAMAAGTSLFESHLPPPPTATPAVPALLSPVDNAGNTMAKARTITVRPTVDTYTDSIGGTDRNDYYRFTIRQQSDFRLSLDRLTADADVSLLNSSGRVITTSAAAGTTAESIAQTLDSGTYFVRVFPYSRTTNYRLGVSAAPPAPTDLAGNSFAEARAITAGTTTSTFEDWVGDADRDDYYRFTLAEASDFRLALDGLAADADVTLHDTSGAVVAKSEAGGTDRESIERRLEAGNYFVRVYPYAGNTRYTLGVSATPVAPPDLAGNTFATGRTIPVLDAATSYQDWVGAADTDDFYRFTLGGESAFSLSLDGLSADADVELLDRDGVVLARSTACGNSPESITANLGSGSYGLHVVRYSGDTPYTLTVSAVSTEPTPDDWFAQNLRDSAFGALARALANDGTLDRFDVISLFRNTEDGSVIDADEVADLRAVVANASRFHIADDVRFLANCVANGNTANDRSGIGNLDAGSSQTRLESLVGKWFLGAGRPATQYSYSFVAGALFQNGPNADDVSQGAVGDCYYVATLSSLAQEKPNVIRDMFVDNGDNTWSVRFFHDGVAEYVTVDRYLPTSGGGRAYASWGGGSATSPANELWVALAEKAYAQLAEMGWSRGANATNSYETISGGWMDDVIEQVAGLSTVTSNATRMTQSQLVGLVNSNQVVTVGFVNGAGYGVVNGHAYSIASFDATTGRFRLRNPWGTTHADVTFAQLQSLQGWVMVSTT